MSKRFRFRFFRSEEASALSKAACASHFNRYAACDPAGEQGPSLLFHVCDGGPRVRKVSYIEFCCLVSTETALNSVYVKVFQRFTGLY